MLVFFRRQIFFIFLPFYSMYGHLWIYIKDLLNIKALCIKCQFFPFSLLIKIINYHKLSFCKLI